MKYYWIDFDVEYDIEGEDCKRVKAQLQAMFEVLDADSPKTVFDFAVSQAKENISKSVDKSCNISAMVTRFQRIE